MHNIGLYKIIYSNQFNLTGPAQVNITCGPEADDESFQLLAVVYRNTAINLAPKTTYDESDETSASEDTTRATDFTSQHDLGGLANRRSTTAAASSGDTSFFGSISHHRLSHRNAESTTGVLMRDT